MYLYPPHSPHYDVHISGGDENINKSPSLCAVRSLTRTVARVNIAAPTTSHIIRPPNACKSVMYALYWKFSFIGDRAFRIAKIPSWTIKAPAVLFQQIPLHIWIDENMTRLRFELFLDCILA